MDVPFYRHQKYEVSGNMKDSKDDSITYGNCASWYFNSNESALSFHPLRHFGSVLQHRHELRNDIQHDTASAKESTWLLSFRDCPVDIRLPTHNDRQ